MNHMHQPVTIAKIHSFLPLGVVGQAKKPFFQERHLWDVPLLTNESTEDHSIGPHQFTRDYLLTEQQKAP